MIRYPKFATTVIGAYSVPDWFEALDRLVAVGQLPSRNSRPGTCRYRCGDRRGDASAHSQPPLSPQRHAQPFWQKIPAFQGRERRRGTSLLASELRPAVWRRSRRCSNICRPTPAWPLCWRDISIRHGKARCPTRCPGSLSPGARSDEPPACRAQPRLCHSAQQQLGLCEFRFETSAAPIDRRGASIH